ncbi:techylectin-5B-like [Ixodes scapularis]
MFVAVLFIPVVAGNVFLESGNRRLPKITERNKQEKPYMIYDPCRMEEARNEPVSCSQLRMRGENKTSQYYFELTEKVRVTCDMETGGGGWTLIQRRGPKERNPLEFEKSYQQYEKEFGDASTSYWIGNDNIHLLTSFSSNKQALRIELWKTETKSITVEYGRFAVGSKKDDYQLSIGEYKKGGGNDALTLHNGARFATRTGKDGYSGASSCNLQSGGWWFTKDSCDLSNLNGRKLKAGHSDISKGLGIAWYNPSNPDSYKDAYYKVEMKIRDADFEFCLGNLIYDVL